MRPTGHFDYLPVGVQEDPVVASVGIGLEETAIVLQERGRAVAGPTGGEVVDTVGMPVIADVDPEPTCRTARLLAPQHSHGGVIGPDDRRLQHQGLLEIGQRLEDDRGVADPVAQGAPRRKTPCRVKISSSR